MTDCEIRYGMLIALRTNNIEEARRLQGLRHDLIENEALEQHKLIESSFERLWEEKSNTWLPPYHSPKAVE